MRSRAPVTLVLLRHGHVDGIGERFRGHAPLALTSRGRREAAALAARIAAGPRLGAIRSSPLARALETARAVAAPLGLEVAVEAALTDIDYGVWQGLTYDEARRRDPEAYEAWTRAPQLALVPHGETLVEVGLRAVRVLHDLHARHAGEAVAVVSHDAFLRIVLLGALDLPFSRYRTIVLDPCSFSVLRFDGIAYDVRCLNDTSHLLGIDRETW